MIRQPENKLTTGLRQRSGRLGLILVWRILGVLLSLAARNMARPTSFLLSEEEQKRETVAVTIEVRGDSKGGFQKLVMYRSRSSNRAVSLSDQDTLSGIIRTSVASYEVGNKDS